jgi:hypothetical protein
MSTQRTIQADFLETETGTITLPQNFTGNLSSPVKGIATVDFSTGLKTSEVVITGLPFIDASSVISVNLRIEATVDHPVDDLIVDPVEVLAKDIVNGVGFTIVCNMPQGKGRGLYKINWIVN